MQQLSRPATHRTLPCIARRLVSHMGLASIVCLGLSAFSAQAQDYPSKPIKIIAPFPTGTGPDANTREIAAELTKCWARRCWWKTR